MPAVQPRFSGTPSPQIRPAPSLGAHTDEVLRELAGLSAGQIAELRQAGTV
jgi:formyl-CoA transferase